MSGKFLTEASRDQPKCPVPGTAQWCCVHPAHLQETQPIKILAGWRYTCSGSQHRLGCHQSCWSGQTTASNAMKRKTLELQHYVFKYQDICSVTEQVILMMKTFIMLWELLKTRLVSSVTFSYLYDQSGTFYCQFVVWFLLFVVVFFFP